MRYWFKEQVMLPLHGKNDVEALKSFALAMAIAFPFVFMGILPWLFTSKIPIWPLYVALVFSFLQLFRPSALYYPYVAWMIFASVLGWINTRIILALAFYLLIVPTGLVMQWRKGLQYRSQSTHKSAWITRETPPKKENLKEPF